MTAEEYNGTMADVVWEVKRLPSPLKEYWIAKRYSDFAEWTRTYQLMHGLTIDGKLGSRTWKRMTEPCSWLGDTQIHGKGFWVWRASQLDGGKVDARVGVPSAIERMLKLGISHVFLKVADGRSIMPGELLKIAKLFQQNNVKVFPWVFPYAYETDAPLQQEIAVHLKQASLFNQELGSDVFVINAEKGFLRSYTADGRVIKPKHQEHATAYLEGLRAAGMKLALSSYGLANDWSKTSFAWKEFLSGTDIWMPQSYWSVKSVYKNNPRTAMVLGAESWRSHIEGEGATHIPIIPSGGCYQVKTAETNQWKQHYHTPSTIQEFVAYAKELQLPHATFWCYLPPEKGSSARVTEEQFRALKTHAWWF